MTKSSKNHIALAIRPKSTTMIRVMLNPQARPAAQCVAADSII